MAITESRIRAIELRLDELTQNFVQTQINQAPITNRVDATANKVEQITPYTETKTAYIDDTFLVFTNVPNGNLTVYFDKAYTVEREADRVTVRFEALDEVTPITISII